MKGFKYIIEAAYVGNIGFEEMVKFYSKASKADEKEMDKAVKENNFEKFKELVFKVLGTKLK